VETTTSTVETTTSTVETAATTVLGKTQFWCARKRERHCGDGKNFGENNVAHFDFLLPYSIRCDGITLLVVKSEECEADPGIAST
jgi:hypothetical protein